MYMASEYIHTQYIRVFTFKRLRNVKNFLTFKLLISKKTLCFQRKKISSPQIAPKLIESEHQLLVYILGNFDAIVSLSKKLSKGC